MFKVTIELDGEVINKDANDIYAVMGIMTMYPGYKSVKAVNEEDGKKLVKKKEESDAAN